MDELSSSIDPVHPDEIQSQSSRQVSLGPPICRAADKLRELRQLFLDEAGKYQVMPLDDRRIERFDPDLAGRTELIRGSEQLLFGGTGRQAITKFGCDGGGLANGGTSRCS